MTLSIRTSILPLTRSARSAVGRAVQQIPRRRSAAGTAVCVRASEKTFVTAPGFLLSLFELIE